MTSRDITPLDRFIAEYLLRRGRITIQDLSKLNEESLPQGSLTLADVLVEHGYLDLEERRELAMRFLRMQEALDSSRQYETPEGPVRASGVKAPDLPRRPGDPTPTPEMFHETQSWERSRRELADTIFSSNGEEGDEEERAPESWNAGEKFSDTVTDEAELQATQTHEETDEKASAEPNHRTHLAQAREELDDTLLYSEEEAGAGSAEESSVSALDSSPPGPMAEGLRSVSLFSGTAAGLEALSRGMRSGKVDISKILSPEEVNDITNRRARLGADGSMIGQLMGGHVVVDKIGQGAMGQVYLAKQLSLSRYVALKVLPPRHAADKDFVDRFVYEANLLAKLTHTNIVQVYDVQIADGNKLFFTMENVQGKSLKDLIAEEGQLPVDAAINIVKQVCRALGAVKRLGITHRDIKPANILLDDQGTVKVVDFGLADFTHALQSQKEGHTAGTPYYMSPEALRNEPATHQSDQYSLGATLYHMLTGQPPFPARDLPELIKKHLEAPPPAASDVNTLVPSALDRIIQRMMAKEPADRYPTFRAIFEELERVEIKMGYRVDPEQFLADRLVDLAGTNVRNLKANIALWAGVGLAATYTAIGLHALTWEHMKQGSAYYLVDAMGNWGFYIVTIAYCIILYIGSVRKRLLPAWGSIRKWLQVHMFLAFVGSMMVIYHGGNILRDYIALSPIDRQLVKPVALLPLLNTVVLILVVISGLIGRFIYTDLQRQLQLQRFGKGARETDEERMNPHLETMLVISHRLLGYWRIVHYPMTIVFFLLAILHIVTIMYFGGSFFPTHPDAALMEALR